MEKRKNNVKKPTEEQERIAMELYYGNPFVKNWIISEQKHYYELGKINGEHKFNSLNFFQGLCIGFIIGATIMKIALS